MAIKIFRSKQPEELMSSSLDEVKKSMNEDYDSEQIFDANNDGKVDKKDLFEEDLNPSSELAKAQQIIKESDELLNEDFTFEDNNPETYILSVIEGNKCSTIGIKMEDGDLLFTCVYPDGPVLKRYEGFGKEQYIQMCEKVFQLNMDEKYNCSRSVNFHGVKARVYAVMAPLVEEPNITISTTKTPPSSLNLPIDEEILDQLVHSNFIICGASGSGKTYLTNYLLSKYIKDYERIAFVEEFSELNPPNDFTISIVTPPAKPGHEPLLRFVTEQSNLMRLDAIYVGEVKGAEAFPMVVNMASGTRGGCTIHGNSPRQAISRLRTLCQLGATNIKQEAIDEFISKSIQYVVQMKKHKIVYIGKLAGTHNNGNFSMDAIYELPGWEKM